MPSETLFPTSIEGTPVNLVSPTVAEVNEDIDTGSPDTDFHEYDTGTNNVEIRYGFDDPTGDLTSGATQNFRVRMRKSASGGQDPSVILRLYEGGTDTGVSSTTSVTNDTTFAEYNLTWTVASLTAASGTNAEFFIEQNSGANSGNPNSRRGIEISAVNWDLDFQFNPGGQPESNVVWV